MMRKSGGGNLRYDSVRLADFSYTQKKKTRGKIDFVFLLLTLMLLACGVIMVLSSSYARHTMIREILQAEMQAIISYVNCFLHYWALL